NSGKAFGEAISPDGRYLAFLSGETGQTMLWIQQVATGSKVSAGPLASKLEYDRLVYSPDGTYLYYVGSDKGDSTNSIYRISEFGGPAQKLITDVDSHVSLSADGKRLAFARGLPGGSALVVANADGTGEQELATLKDPDFYWAVALSADGAKI